VVYSEGNEAAMSFQEFVGWSASAVLVLTIVTQVYRQWQQGSSKGVSKWLFIGQMAASSGFLLYSWLIHDVVFLFTNALMMMSAAVGLGIVLWHRMKRPDEEDAREPQ
jgi:MtN3 and saliva related transmembrane protein